MLNSFTLATAPVLYKWAMTVVMSTCSVRTVGVEHLKELQARGQPALICCWHNNTAMTVCHLRHQRLAMMASASRDGELIARAIEKFGNTPVRGSSSSLGSQAARNMVRALRAGASGAMTPDGPRGPAYRCQSGAIWIAALSGCPLLPYELQARRQWRTRSWDRHKIPKPFTTIHEYIGEPFYVGRDNAASEATLRALQAHMLQNTRACLEAAGHEDEAGLLTF